MEVVTNQTNRAGLTASSLEGTRAGVSSTPASPNFVPLRGGAPGPAGILVGVNLHAVDYCYGCWDERIGQSVLRLAISSGRTIQVTGRDEVELFLDLLGLEGRPWKLNLERDIE
jgi:hypothetical protein